MTGELENTDICKPAARTAVVAHNSAIDELKLGELAEILSAERFEAILASYLSHARQQLTQMDVLAADLNYTALATVAHDLKGISGTFGAVRMQHLAEKLERACQLGEAAKVTSILREIRTASQAASIAIGARMGHRIPAMAQTAS